ncbi:MAG: glycosyltransferase family 2 protein [Salinivirgaceae bacterium]|nr:glycosyltransferase family 2 protein [Salinivirgaceae bacterium]
MHPKVSVIIPNYNHAAYLPQRIESVLNQTITGTEIIILDDCSTDSSREIIMKYARNESRIITCFNDENSESPFKQWKKGIDMAKGELIWIAESDDFADKVLLEKLVSILDKNQKVGVAYCQSNFVDEKGNVFGNHLENLKQLDSQLWETDFCIEGRTVLSEFMPIINIIPNASAALFRKSLLTDMNWGKLNSFTLAGDRYFWIHLLRNSFLGFVSGSYNNFRFSNTTVRSRTDKTVRYLKEIRTLYVLLLSQVPISWRVKRIAIRQWIRHFIKSIKSRDKKTSIVIRGLWEFAVILVASILGHKIVSHLVAKTIEKH